VSFFGCLGYELDLDHLLPVEQKEIKEQIALYKKYRGVFQFGRFSRLKNGWQVSQGKTAIAGVFRKLGSASPGYEQLRLKQLDPKKCYHFRNRPQELRIGQFGSLVKHVAPVNLNPNGFVLRTADRHMTMHDGMQELVASGAALMNGINLLPLFRGTGYHEKQRTLLDFGSEIYIAQEVSNEES
jgi:alpha-galactosidase